jgi:hypothetical protein
MVLAFLLAPADVLSQTPSAGPAEILEELHDLQEEFERYRESRIPVEMERSGGSCDERIGRICIWFGGDGEESYPAEFREVKQARIELIRSLFDGFEETNDA